MIKIAPKARPRLGGIFDFTFAFFFSAAIAAAFFVRSLFGVARGILTLSR